jgi:hypothetical protein
LELSSFNEYLCLLADEERIKKMEEEINKEKKENRACMILFDSHKC